MTFVLEALRDKPQFLYPMNDTAPFDDLSGYARVSTSLGGTPTTHISLMNGVGASTVFSSANTGRFTSSVFKQGSEDKSFSLEAWVRVIGSAAEQQILGNTGAFDGITINGTVVSFVTKYLTAPEARASFDIQQNRAVHVVGVHTNNKNLLFIDGALVDEVSITEAQLADKFIATSDYLYSGGTSGAQNIAVNGLASYASALNNEQIFRHYSTGRNLLSSQEVISSNLGNYIPLSIYNSDIFADQWWSVDEDWNEATLRSVSVRDNQLVPQFTENTSIAGDWIDNFVLDPGGITSIYGVVLNWDGIGVTISVSLDGTTWETAIRGKKVSLISEGFNPTDKVLQVRASFPGGIVDDESYLDNLNVVGLRTGLSPEVAGRTITFTNSSQEREYLPQELNDNWGVEINSGGSVVISADTLESTVARTLEVWIKRTGTNPTISMTGTTYINGAVGTATLPLNQWVLMHVVAAANVTGSITINGPAQVGSVGIYTTALSAAQVSAVYAQYYKANAINVRDNFIVGVTDSTIEPKVYAFDWSILSSG